MRSNPRRWIWIIVGVGVGLPLLIGLGIDFFGSNSDESNEAVGEPSAQVAESAESADPEGWQILLIIGFIILCFIFSGWLARYLLRRMSRADILEDGVPGSARIISMGETGTTVNDHPMVDFELLVTRDGSEPYQATARQMLPRLLLGRVEPGLEVGVKVLAADPSKVAIDWESISGGKAAGGPTMTTGLFEGATVGETVDTEEFLLRAIPATAEIDQMSETGRTAANPRSGEEYEVFAFVLTVQPEASPAYEAKLLQGVPAEHIGRVGPGATVPVGVDPDDPSDVAINWREHERAERRRPTGG
jgi:hypothetical protein